jgi:DNA-binding protein HU-beta
MANKAQLIEALSERLGDKKVAAEAVDGLVDIIIRTVNKGEKVNITGFGVFEKRARAARLARNPRTGEPVRVKKTNVPAFRAGTTFKEVIGGSKKLSKASVAKRGSTTTTRGTTTRATRTTTSRTTRPATTRATTRATRATATTATKTRKTAAAKTTAKAPARKTAATSRARTTTRAKATAKRPAAASRRKK